MTTTTTVTAKQTTAAALKPTATSKTSKKTNEFNHCLTLAANDGSVDVTKALLRSGNCNINETVVFKKLQDPNLSPDQKKCWQYVLETTELLDPVFIKEFVASKWNY